MTHARRTFSLSCLIVALAACSASRPALQSSSSPAAFRPASPCTSTPLSITVSSTPSASPSDAGSEPLSTEAAEYADTARRIREASLASDGAFQKLSVLTDQIGPRLSGSAALEHAVAWAKDTFTADHHERVTLEPVRVPHWVRGAQSALLVAPFSRPLNVLALGGSVATSAAGLTAELLAVSSFEELERRQAEVKGKIVLFDHPMSGQGNPGRNYGEALPYRTTGASRAARFGAVAVLVRSVTAHSLGAPHTGSMHYFDGKDPKIPAAAITVEEAELLHRLASHGDNPKVHLALSPQTLPDANSDNVSAEIRGRELPEQVVLIGAHLDSWDVGQGAQDDGAGVVTVMQALNTLRSLGLVPRRTLRAVLFTNEENGVRGAAQYAKDHAGERHVAAFEMDTGSGAPRGFSCDGEPPYLAEAQGIAELLGPLGANHVLPGYAGEDVSALKPAGVPLFGVMLDIEHYFDVHHSAADTLDKVEPENLKKAVAALATMAFVVADRDKTWDAPANAPPTPRP